MEQITEETNPLGTIIFDTSSGISLEEQKEILAGINSLTGENRLPPNSTEIAANKKGYLFPLFVNAGAFVLLILGIALLSFIHVKDEREIRESAATLGHTERILIQEIRVETERLVREKESQIDDVLSKLSSVNAEYKELLFSVENLSEAQKQRAAALLVLQGEYQQSLSLLQNEKAQILEDSRQKEAVLRTQAEERARELSSKIEQGQTSLGEAAEELRRLGSEQDRVNRAENQMSGFYTTVNNQISSGRLEEAAATLEAMKEFLAAPSLQGSRSMDARRQTHMTAIAMMERAIIASKSGGLLSELTAEKAALEQRNANLERDLAAFSSQGSDQVRIISEYVSAIQELEAANVDQIQALNRQNSEIDALRTEINRREQQAAELNSNINTLQTQNAELQSQKDDLQRRMEAAIRAFTGE